MPAQLVTPPDPVRVVPVGPLREMCCLVDDGSGGVCVVDPGAEWPRIERALAGRPVSRVLLTHFHDDHTGALNDVLAAFPDADWVVGAEDAPMLWPGVPRTESYIPPAACREPGLLLHGGEALEVGDLRLEVIACPGHSHGGMTYYGPRLGVAFVGDTLFAGSAGRCDLLGGDEQALLSSLARLAKFPPETRVYPGHGPATTIAAELATNPYLRRAARL